MFLTGWMTGQLASFPLGPAKRRWFGDRLALHIPRMGHERPLIWCHASSLGEVTSVIPLLQALRHNFPHTQVLSVSTVRGEYVARQKSGADYILALPFDISYLVDKALRRIRPDVMVVFETEIWPNLFWKCSAQHIPVLIISGRISPRSFQRYRLARPFFSSVLAEAECLMQTEEDRARIVAIGANPLQVSVGGDIKLDGLRTRLAAEDMAWLNQNFSFTHPMIVAGSTHPGEEEMLLLSFQLLQKNWPELTLLLAPRHLNRMPEIVRLLQTYNIPYQLRSQLTGSLPRSGVILLDSYGELARIYWLADVVFVGGTMVPVGGHNLMEPGALGKPVVFGPYVANCKKQAELLRENAGCCQVTSPQELTRCLSELLQNPSRAATIGRKAQEIVQANVGAMQTCIDKIQELLRI